MDCITNLCQNKIAVSSDVEAKLKRQRTKAKLDLSFIPFYKMSQSCFKMHFLFHSKRSTSLRMFINTNIIRSGIIHHVSRKGLPQLWLSLQFYNHSHCSLVTIFVNTTQCAF